MKHLKPLLTFGILVSLTSFALADTGTGTTTGGGTTTTGGGTTTTGGGTTTGNGGRLYDSQNCASSSYGHFRAHVHL